jgi:tetratricopeptide (TPR) repeat protein
MKTTLSKNSSGGINRLRAVTSKLGWVALFAVLVGSPSIAGAIDLGHLDRDIAIMQKILKSHPDAEIYYRLGDLYVQKGRQTGDITYYNLADGALRQGLKLMPDFEPAHRHLAFVRYALHDFAEASSEARRAIQLDSQDPYAFGVLGDAQLETGDYPAAEATYAHMVTLHGDLYSYSRRSSLETIFGEDRAAVADLKHAIQLGQRAGEPPEGIAWAQTMLAQDYFLMGRLEDAASFGTTALQTYPAYHLALAIMGRVRAAQGRMTEAIDYYNRAIAVIPLPEYAAALSDLYTATNHSREAQQQRQLVEFIAHLNELNRVLYNRVLVDYYADHDISHQRAVDYAATEYKVRRDIYGEDALAWALYRDGRAEAALPHVKAALRFHTTDARLYFHAGLIYERLGRSDEARSSLRQALTINPHFQPLLDQVATHEYAQLSGNNVRQYANNSNERQ